MLSRHALFTFLVASLFIIPSALLTYRHSSEARIPFYQEDQDARTMELSVTFTVPASGEARRKRQEFRFWLPDGDPHWKVIDEQTNSGPFSLGILEEDGSRVAILSHRGVGSESLSAEYRLILTREKSDLRRKGRVFTIPKISKGQQKQFRAWSTDICGGAITELEKGALQRCIPELLRFIQHSQSNWLTSILQRDEFSEAEFARLFLTLLEGEGLDGEVRTSIPLKGYQFSVEPRLVLYFDTPNTVELAYDFHSETVENAKGYFRWGEREEIISSTRGDVQPQISVATAAVTPASRLRRDGAQSSKLVQFLTLQRLPAATQALFEFTLLLPLAALVVCVVRNFIGLVTFGTFMPALLGLAFLQTGLFAGLLLSLLVLGAGCLARLAADRLHMLLVPRLAAVLTTVTLLFYLLTQLSFEFSWGDGLQISLFPVVVLTMMVERLTLIIDELGFLTAVSRLGSTLLSALLCYGVLLQEEIQFLFFHFPELNLAVLGVAILFGRYTGYRLTELIRFREFGKELQS
ncbi:hypothetical protein MRY87_13565 [bacterium]|nr:hypothetical protein [bacterium]